MTVYTGCPVNSIKTGCRPVVITCHHISRRSSDVGCGDVSPETERIVERNQQAGFDD
jgi:hypothetical protein